jgi:sulfur carrier protein ThiS
MMQITLKLFANLTDYLPPGSRNNRLELDIDASDTVQGVLVRHQVPEQLMHLVLVNGVYIPPAARATQRLEPGDQVAVWPPIAGG